jgi:hypothetical protein
MQYWASDDDTYADSGKKSSWNSAKNLGSRERDRGRKGKKRKRERDKENIDITP